MTNPTKQWQDEAERLVKEYAMGGYTYLHFKDAFLKGCEFEHDRDASYRELVHKLADWSRKYPRNRVYSPDKQPGMDSELIFLEDLAKILCPETPLPTAPKSKI